jgi:hypothetical protein
MMGEDVDQGGHLIGHASELRTVSVRSKPFDRARLPCKREMIPAEAKA